MAIRPVIKEAIMAKINCPKCGENSLDVMVNISMVIPMDHMHELSKKAIRDKRVEIWGADWDRSSWFCKNPKCLWQKIAPNPRWVETQRKLEAEIVRLKALIPSG
jgi:hypothetical protein